ncbi:MAG: ABC transporter permease [Piscinibacter sp.]|uniref:ABC transporter permease n=1 Tax=Piscinibacter TaxID=1114981 RepID=UPI000FDF18C3|nr:MULTISPECIES: FtsX-like permease family protein [Piscinibacter]MCW5667479.1 ABC transporter permease [Piscinibacter sp.]
MNTLVLAWRNVRRNGRRSLLTLIALLAGSLGVLLFGGYVNDTIHGLQTSTVRTHGHLQVVARGYLEFGRGNPGRYSIRDPQALIERIRGDAVLAPMVRLATPVLDVEGVAGHYAAHASANFVGQGVVPAERREQLAWDGFGIGIPPSPTALSDHEPAAGTIGVGLAQLLSLCDALALRDCRRQALPVTLASAERVPDDVASLAELAAGGAPAAPAEAAAVELLAASPAGLPNVVRMKVLQAERQGIRQVDSMYVAMPLELSQRLVFGPGAKAVSAIVVQLQHTDQLDAARERLRQLAGTGAQALEVLDFHELSPVYDQIIANYATIFQFIAMLMAVVTLAAVAGAVNMAVSERTAEIGTLRSLGFQRGTIRQVFLLEGTLLGLGGTLAGTLLAFAASVAINVSGLSWTPPGRSEPIPIFVDIASAPLLVLATVLGLTLIAALSAWRPAQRAARMEVAEALRHA